MSTIQGENGVAPTNPLNPAETLKRPLDPDHIEEAHPPQPPLEQDSAVTKAEKVERHGFEHFGPDAGPAAKRAKTEVDESPATTGELERKKGSAPIKAEYLILRPSNRNIPAANGTEDGPKVDARDARDARDSRDNRNSESTQKSKKQKGQNTSRHFGSSRDALQLCMSRARAPEFSPKKCQFGDSCKYEHNLRRYLKEGKREDLTTFDGHCPVYDAMAICTAGWRCRSVGAHSQERTTSDGRKELVLLGNDVPLEEPYDENSEDTMPGVVNVVPAETKINLRKRKVETHKADAYTEFLNKITERSERDIPETMPGQNGTLTTATGDAKQENRARYVEPPFLPSEKRRIYYGPETPVLAPLTTQGNLPFRRLCVELGAQITWSEMAMGLPLVQGEKSEWALMKAHESELTSPKFTPGAPVVEGYDNSKDFKFGVQIAGNKPWVTLKTTEIVTRLCPNVRAVDLNCGCPIDLVYRQGAGSALLDSPAKLEKILRGMNAVSGEVPITVKIRMGTKDNKPTADRLVNRLSWGGPEANEMGLGPAGVAAITLHGRSRQQRYTRSADWSYISKCAALINNYERDEAGLTDTVREVDERNKSPNSKMYFIGNGDCYSHIDYQTHIKEAKVDSVMVARGALVKPWVFEEIEKGQYLDKSSKERLEYVEKFAKYGLQAWGSDEIGVGITRRFLLEWLSFSCRYVPIGLLEYLPPNLQDRPPAYRGRDDLETLLASENYKDWIKISEMYLGPAHKDFHFEPKHRSNSYEIEAEG